MIEEQAAMDEEEALDPRRVAAILEAVEAGDGARLRELCAPLHAADIAMYQEKKHKQKTPFVTHSALHS